MNLIIDDIRDNKMCFNTSKKIMFLELDWQIVRNYKQFVDFINKNGVDGLTISFDHDLNDFDGELEYTGKTAADYLIDYCQLNNKKFPNWFVHSDNTSGKKNIISAILSYMKHIEGRDISDFRYFHNGIINGKNV